MAFECANHPGADAVWMCVGCESVLCPDCVVIKTYGRTQVDSCKSCGELCTAVVAGVEVSEDELSGAFVDAWVYPLRDSGPLILLGGTAVASLFQFFAAGLGSLLGFGLFLAYGMAVIRSTADGRSTAPQWPDTSTIFEIAWPVVLASATTFLSFGPAAWAAGQGRGALAAGLLVAGALYAPMAWIAASVSGNFLAITPLTVVPLLFKINATYWIACAVLLPMAVLGQLGMGVLDAMVPSLVGVPLLQATFFYLLMVEMRILGIVWYRNKDELGLS
ncbi:MAG: B-box zinc finger protein [Myxococcota bacterium]